jgi:hypothetical protein
MSYRRLDIRRRVPRQTCIFTPFQSARRVCDDSPVNVIRQPLGDLVPAAADLRGQVPGPEAGGFDYESAAGARRDQDRAGEQFFVCVILGGIGWLMGQWLTAQDDRGSA